MNPIKIIALGKLKEPWWKNAQEHYIRKIALLGSVEVLELQDLQAGENLSEKEEEQVKEKEGKQILAAVKKEEYVVAMDLRGEPWEANQWPQQTGILDRDEMKWWQQGLLQGNPGAKKTEHGDKKTVVFVIGGSLGLSQEVLRRANKRLCFSPMTFPHQLFRIVLLEQLTLLTGKEG